MFSIRIRASHHFFYFGDFITKQRHIVYDLVHIFPGITVATITLWRKYRAEGEIKRSLNTRDLDDLIFCGRFIRSGQNAMLEEKNSATYLISGARFDFAKVNFVSISNGKLD